MLISIPVNLSQTHRNALAWFVANEGKKVGWPLILKDGTLLANKAKGIYKPAWSRYALSVKQTLKSPYADHDPTYSENGSWSYLYYQEEQAGKDPESLPSNKAMRECMLDSIPIGVLRQLSPKPNVQYAVLGLARIIGKAAGYYLLEGAVEESSRLEMKAAAEFSYSKEPELVLRVAETPDLRIRRLRSVVQRQGQPKFREQLLEIYERRCAVTSCDLTDVLEAAHVMPYRGQHTNDVSNGIVLRADLHILFDEGLLAFDPATLSVQLAPVVRSNGHYEKYNGILLHPGARYIDPELLKAHKHYCGF